MGIEEPQQPEDLNLMKQEILDRFSEGGFSETVEKMLDEWVDKRSKEADKSGKMESRIDFELELLELRNNLDQDAGIIVSELEELKIAAFQEGLDDLADKIEFKIREILDIRD